VLNPILVTPVAVLVAMPSGSLIGVIKTFFVQ
jgi:hypothetical protein